MRWRLAALWVAGLAVVMPVGAAYEPYPLPDPSRRWSVNVGMRAGEPNGLSVGNEVNFVTTLGEFESEFGGDNTTATISGITSDPDLHVAGLSLQSRLFTFDGINGASIQISEWKWGICLRVGGWSGGRL